MSNLNAKIALVERVYRVFQQNIGGKRAYSFYRANMQALSLYDETEFYQTSSPELSSYIVAKTGRGAVGTLPYEAGIIPEVTVGDVATYTFTEPFAETPVVLATPIYTSTQYPLMWRVFDVTPTGFKVALQRQKAYDDEGKTRVKADLSFFAIAKGTSPDGTGRQFTVRDTTVSFTSTTSLRKVEYGFTVEEPVVLVQMQTLNKDVAATLRTRPYGPEADNTRVRFQVDNTNKDITVSTKDPATERLGMIIIGKDPVFDGIEAVRTVDGNGKLAVYPVVAHESLGIRDDAATMVSLYNMGGQQVYNGCLQDGQSTVDVSSLPSGIYIVRTNAGHSKKVMKK